MVDGWFNEEWVVGEGIGKLVIKGRVVFGDGSVGEECAMKRE